MILHLADLKPRIHIIGGPGSGKSYTAAQLAKRFGVCSCDLDDLFWNRAAPNYGVRAEINQRDQQLMAIVSRDGWIIEGVYYEWLTPSFEKADLIIALIPSIWVRHWRVVMRFIFRKLGWVPSKRESLADLLRLLRWSHSYDANNLRCARECLASQGKQLVTCRTFPEVEASIKLPPG